MYNGRKVTEDLYWVGANEHRLALFENIHPIPKGVSYNAYLLLDENSVLVDAVDWSACRQLMENIQYLLNGRALDYLIINHMEPDHGASIQAILKEYPNVKVIGSVKTFMLMRQFGFDMEGHEAIQVKEGDSYSFGNHTFSFSMAPMVHWPEVMVSFDHKDNVLFSADAFGIFGALDGKLFNDEMDFEREFLDEARRYYTNIVGKYGPHVQSLLKKAAKYPIKMIAPLHGPVWRSNIEWFVDKHDKWSRYEAEEEAVMIAYASMYGNTETVAQVLASKLVERGITNVKLYDVSNTHVSQLISESFRVSHIVLASPTYNMGIYPIMYNFLHDMKELNLQNRTFAIIENGSWASKAGDLMEQFVKEELKNMTILDERICIASSACEDKALELDAMADCIVASLKGELA